MFDGGRRTPPTDALLRNVFIQHTQTHTHTTHTRLLLDCGYSGLYPAKPPQANTVHSDMEIFYWAFLWCINALKSPEFPPKSNLKPKHRELHTGFIAIMFFLWQTDNRNEVPIDIQWVLLRRRLIWTLLSFLTSFISSLFLYPVHHPPSSVSFSALLLVKLTLVSL